MIEIGGVVAVIAFPYAAALVGSVVALASRAWSRRRERVPSLLEATWCAFLPLLAVAVLSVAASVQPRALPPFHEAHSLWHQWEEAVHQSTAGHGALHFANWLVVVAASYSFGRMIFAFSRMRGFESALRSNARAEGDGVYSLASARPLSFSMGLWRPAIYVSTALREHLSGADLRAVLAHEAAHVRRRDTLTSALLTLFYTLAPLPGSRLLLQDWRLAVERQCDEEAAREVGSAFDVAAALVQVARLVKQSPAGLPNSVCFTGWSDDVEGRVQALLGLSERDRLSRWSVGVFAALSLGLVLAAGPWLPHAVEVFAHH